MRKRLNRLPVSLLAGCLLAVAAEARADRIYQYAGEDGVTVLTNVPKGGKRGKARAAAEGGPAASEVRAKALPEYDRFLEEACELYKIPLPLARAVMAVESNFNPQALSPKGAQGLMQLMPQTATEMFVADAFDPRQNIHGGVRYLRLLANQFGGDMVQIVAAYNAGPEAVKRAGGIPAIAETQDYVRKVLRLYFAFKSES